MVNTTASDSVISGMITNYYVRTFIERLEANLVYDKWGMQKPIPENEGATIVWNQLLNPAAGYDLTDGDTPAASAVSARVISATLVYKGDLKSITDQVDMTAICPMVEGTIDMLGYGAALTKDRFISQRIGFGSAAALGAANAASVTLPSVRSQGFPVYNAANDSLTWPNATTGIVTALDNTAIGGLSVVPTIAHIRGAVTQLKQLNAVPWEDGNFRGVISNEVSKNIRNDSTWVTWNSFGAKGKALEKGMLGVIEKVLFEESSEAFTCTVVASAWSAAAIVAGGTIYGTLIFGKNAYGVSKLGSKDAKVTVVSGPDKSDPLNQRTLIGYKVAYAAKVINPSAGLIWAYYKSN